MLIASAQPREMIYLIPGELLDELFSPCCRLFYSLFDVALWIDDFPPMIVLSVSVLEHPGGSFAFLLKYNRHALSQFCHVWNLVEVA